jgi:hypothetical protein
MCGGRVDGSGDEWNCNEMVTNVPNKIRSNPRMRNLEKGGVEGGSNSGGSVIIVGSN